jgi:hypothetical protein
MEHPNIEVKKYYEPDGNVFKYMNINKAQENNDETAALSLAIMRLRSKEIDFVIINKFLFTHEMFEFKSSKKFNSTKARDLFIYQYEIEFYKNILN